MTADRLNGSPNCLSCHSMNLGRFPAEIAIHHPGIKNIDKPAVFVFPELMVCSACGFSQFFVTKVELQSLAISDSSHP